VFVCHHRRPFSGGEEDVSTHLQGVVVGIWFDLLFGADDKLFDVVDTSSSAPNLGQRAFHLEVGVKGSGGIEEDGEGTLGIVLP